MSIFTLEKKLRTGPRSRDFQWYRKLFLQGRLYVEGYPITEEVFEHFRLAIKTTNEIYPADWDIEFKVNSSIYTIEKKIKIELVGIIVKFPEVTITNSKKKRHLIKDLFIRTRFRVHQNVLGIEGVYGTRTTLTHAEHNSRYLHSHLGRHRLEPSNKYFKFNRFCTGSGSINIAIADLNAQGFNEDRFISYLLNLGTLASWESLEGVPYVRIASINNLREGAREFNTNRTVLSAFMIAFKRKLIDTGFKPRLDFKLEPNGVSVIDNDIYDTFIQSITLTESERDCLLCFKSEDGVYYAYGQTPQSVNVPTFPNKILFQGEEIEVKITDTPEDIPTEIQYIYHPKTKLEIKKQLEYAANKAILRKTTVERYKSTTSNIRKNPEPDPIPVPADS